MDNLVTIIVWSSILVIAVTSLIVMLFYAHRFFTCACLTLNFEDEGRYKTIVKYVKKGSEVDLNKIKLPKEFIADFKPYRLKTKTDFQGKIGLFTMPEEDVTIYYKRVDLEAEKKENEVLLDPKHYQIPLVKDIAKAEIEDCKPVLLLDVNDVKTHVELSNTMWDLFPLLNSYLVKKEGEENEYLVLRVGKLIYAIMYYSDVTFKVFIRLDDAFINDKLKNNASLDHLHSDIYSFILDGSFTSFKQFFDIIDRGYQYSTIQNYLKENACLYSCDEDKITKLNSEFLAIDYRLAKNYDPLFDLACQDAQAYIAHKNHLKAIEDKLDEESITSKEMIYDQLEDLDESMEKKVKDTYKVTINIQDPVETDEEIEKSLVGTTPVEVHKELEDIKPITPSLLSMDNMIDFIMVKKDMFSLTIDVSSDMSKSPTTFKFIHRCFALLTKTKKAYRLNLRLDEEYVKNILVVSHPNIVKIFNGDEEDWYKLIIDDTYLSYEELYDIFLKSYEYTKKVYYVKHHI